MRRKFFLAAATAGALALGGVAVAVPAIAETEGTGRSAVERITEALSGLVSDGSLTQEQADEVAGRLSEAGIGDRGGHDGGRLGLGAAATALDMTEDELRAALAAEGTSLADVASEQGVEVGTLVDALVAAAQEDIARAVEEGELTQEEAEERLADLEERVTDRVTSDDRGPGRHGRGPGGPGDRGADAPADGD